jgi:hypothetical protein
MQRAAEQMNTAPNSYIRCAVHYTKRAIGMVTYDSSKNVTNVWLTVMAVNYGTR